MTRAAWPALLAAVCGVAQAQFDDAPALAQPDNAYDRATADSRREGALRKLFEGSAYAQPPAAPAASDAGRGVLQTGDPASWPRLYGKDDLVVTGLLNGAIGIFSMTGNLFAPPTALSPANFQRNPVWGEFFVEPGLNATLKLGAAASVYGSFSYVEASTRGTDNTGAGNVWYGNRELLYAGLRWHDTGSSGLTLDASYGQQDYDVGNQMLVGRGASDSSAQRGANQIGPRNAWANAGIVKATWGDLDAQAFWLKPNEAPDSITGTKLAGINLQWLPAGPVRLGAMYLHVPDSQIVTRDKLNVYDLRARVHPVAAAPNFWLHGEYVAQRKSGVAADGWYLQANYNALDTAWKPLLALRYAALSGDKPGTATWEGFDPLYFSGGNPNWYQGKIGSSIFNNTNLDAASVALTLNPDDRNIIELLFLYFNANQVNSPLAIPAAGAMPASGGGVPRKALASEIDAQYTYVFNKNVNLSAFAAWAAPGAGYKDLYAANGGTATGWWFLGTQINVSY